MYAEKAYLNAFVRYCHLLQAKASSCVLRCTVFFFLLTWLLGNGWTDFHQIFTNRRPCSIIH